MNNHLLQQIKAIPKFIQTCQADHVSIFDFIRFKVDGGNRLKFPTLANNALVFDVGAYDGEYALELNRQYNCRVICFEPIDDFCHIISDRIQNLSNISLEAFGLSSHTCESSINIADNASSLFREFPDGQERQVAVDLADISQYLKDNNINSVQLLKLNIEGGEYDVLNRLFSTSEITIFDSVLVQFHYLDSNSLENVKAIRNRLASFGFTCSYKYDFIWEYWIKNA